MEYKGEITACSASEVRSTESAWSEERTKQLEQFVMYIIEKEAVYLHGVFWMGSDLEEAKKKADEYASHDSDGHHDWHVREFEEVALPSAEGDADHNTVYTTRKACA